MSMREEFEAAYFAFYRIAPVYIVGFGIYADRHVDAAWWAWLASRAALVIELPEPSTPETFGVTKADDPDQYEALEARHGAQYAAISQCRRAIEATGVTVKA